MACVKATPEDSLVVVAYCPYRYWVRCTLFIVIVVLLVVGSYYSGFYRGSSTEKAAIVERDQLRNSYAEKIVRIEELEQQVANLALGSQVDRKATEQVRARVVELKNQIAELERDNTFYRDLMRPDNEDTGISVGVPTITSVKVDNTYEYKMVVKQLDANRLKVRGYLEFDLVGKNGEKDRRISLQEVSDNIDSGRIKLNFRYFQRIEGQMVLPQDFTPDRIELKVVLVRPKKTLIEKKFKWSIKES
ncbi:hypothetical protein AB835_02025 [Candidatus Endobugula sertula]|uniref:Uncharacterized protein n=1 Tax=Candidatus Endobugula sertula TaxID=62101 RepID=A0A1D2QSY8_9GAMM|nr:hypothetical protein AB835_02025 [Candidatus Endobugula sertula]